MGLFIASLDPTTDAETWLDLAKESQNQGMDLTIAISCYRSAYAKSGDGNIKQQMGNLYLKTQQWTLALQSFKQAFKSLSSDRGVEALKHARTMAREIYIFSRKSDPETSDKLKYDALQVGSKKGQSFDDLSISRTNSDRTYKVKNSLDSKLQIYSYVIL